MSHLPSHLPSDFARDAALCAIAASHEDPANEAKMRAALELVPCSSIILGPQWYEKPWQLNNIKLCKELKKPMILVCWKDFPPAQRHLGRLARVGRDPAGTGAEVA